MAEREGLTIAVWRLKPLKKDVRFWRERAFIREVETLDDMGLLREYAVSGSEAAFAMLVSRRVRFVYAAALRQLRDPGLAEEVTQAVFIILAQKADKISGKTILSGWLFKTTRFVALAQMRARARRLQYEKEAQLQAEPENAGTDALWEQMSPLLDEALTNLGQTDRQALLLRFFEDRTLAEVGRVLGTGEDTARMRVNRALEKLRKYFLRRGVVSTAVFIAGALAADSARAASAGTTAALAKSVAAAAVAKGATASEATLMSIKGGLKLMAWTKAKMAMATTAAVLLAGGAATVGVVRYEASRAKFYSWRISNLSAATLRKVEPQVSILRTKFSAPVYAQVWAPQDRYAGVRVQASELARIAYGTTPGRILFPDGEPRERYDFAVTVPESPKAALQREIKKRLGVVGKLETVETDVMVLKVKTPNAAGLKEHDPALPHTGYYDLVRGRIVSIGRPIATQPPELPLGLTKLVEGFVKVPVIDETGLTNLFDIDMRWDEAGGQDSDHEALKQALTEQLGLELVPDRRSVEMLVMEKAK